MNKTELVDELAIQTAITKVAAAKIIDELTAIISAELSKGGEVALPGFGSFVVANRAARQGRNPQTGAVIKIAADRVVKFKVGKKLKDSVSTK
ncbi:MAG: HU family DNA-binding protein [Legionellaceae bacterium]|nr:HU family DNA-binding protein [Legionellaceae bacterium]MBP9774997.1 HU family DNA-binding protein [Legionellaceae bacterium]